MAEFKIRLEEIREAQKRIVAFAARTPLQRWEFLRRRLNLEAPLFLKLETLQNTGSFKVRGASNKLLTLIEEKRRPTAVIAASAGNHAQGVAYVAGKLGIPATIVMPEGSPLVKVAATSDYGAQIILHGLVYDDAYAKAQEILKEKAGSVYVHAYEDEKIIAGQGTTGIEIHEQLLEREQSTPQLQVIVPIGGGGLMSGIAIALKALRPGVEIYGVVSDAAPSMAESFKAGKAVKVPGRTRTLAEGLAVKSVSEAMLSIIRENVKDVAVVSDAEIAEAISILMERGKLVVEGSGAAGVAALLAGKIKLNPKIPTVVLLCGGNIDLNLISNILERGFTRTGRWMSFGVFVDDKPGELSRLTKRIGELRGNVLEVEHDRLRPDCPLGQTYIKFRLETRGHEHAQKIEDALKLDGLNVEHLVK